MSTCATFDPWTARPEDALRAQDAHDPLAGPGPLAQYEAALQVTAARAKCLAADGGCAVLKAITTCAVNRLVAPRWLADAMASRHAKVEGAEVGSWDEAFGRPWPAKTRLPIEQRRIRLKPRVHAKAFALALAAPYPAINRKFFEAVARAVDAGVSASEAERLYYAALEDGFPNPKAVRDAQANPQLSPGLLRIDGLLAGGHQESTAL